MMEAGKGWGGRWRRVEMKLARHADRCEEEREVKMLPMLRELVWRKGESRVGFWTSNIHWGDTCMETLSWCSDVTMEVRRERS